MKEAVSSAEQWKEFAEKLGADKDATEATLAAAQASLQVGSYKQWTWWNVGWSSSTCSAFALC